ncbi:Uncharacterised protein [Mycobacteroides abscessus subsp. abscessus]|nr:Uncharacterised protein [Mycobacteroides abscessus subsp. abscessus]
MRLRQREITLAHNVLVGHRRVDAGGEALTVLDRETHLRGGSDKFDVLDPPDAHTCDPHIVAFTQPEDIGEHRSVGHRGTLDIPAQGHIHQPGQRRGDDQEDGQPDQRAACRGASHRAPPSSCGSAARVTTVPRARGPSTSWSADVAGCPRICPN